MMRQQHMQIWPPGEQGNKAHAEHFHYSHEMQCEGAPSSTVERIGLGPTMGIKYMKK